MKFTYGGYSRLLNMLKEHGYSFVNYHNWQNSTRCVILRHDIDMSIEKACLFAELESKLDVKSTYFVLITSDFYNVLSKKGFEGLTQIISFGHEIGLHFDEKRYCQIFGKPELIKEKILKEAYVLSHVLNREVTTVSMHRPSKEILESNLNIPGMINSYEHIYFNDFKYLSDSRRCWREPVEDIIKAKSFGRLHILTHPFWYNEKEKDLRDSLFSFIMEGNRARYAAEKDNVTGTDIIVSPEEVL